MTAGLYTQIHRSETKFFHHANVTSAWRPDWQASGYSSPGARAASGQPVCACFAAEGAEVIVHYHQGRERAEAAGGASVAGADLTNEADVERLFAEVGPLDVCAAIAGVWPAGDVPVWELSLERWRADARREPDRDVPHRPRLPGATRRPRRLARPLRLDRRPDRRGRPRRLRRGQVGDPGRPAPLAEERGRAPKRPLPRERRRARLDRVADDARVRRRGAGAPDLEDDGAA